VCYKLSLYAWLARFLASDVARVANSTRGRRAIGPNARQKPSKPSIFSVRLIRGTALRGSQSDEDGLVSWRPRLLTDAPVGPSGIGKWRWRLNGTIAGFSRHLSATSFSWWMPFQKLPTEGDA